MRVVIGGVSGAGCGTLVEMIEMGGRMSRYWEGPFYRRTRLLLLGESAYSWLERGKVRHPSAKHCRELVEWTIRNFTECVSQSVFMTKLARALANEENPSAERLRFVWDRVAFTNYVSGTVGFGPRVRPTGEMWKNAKQAFPALLDELKPLRIVVLGKEMWGKMPPAPTYISDDVQGYTLGDGTVAICWALNHPARGLSWQDLAAVIHFACEKELRG